MPRGKDGHGGRGPRMVKAVAQRVRPSNVTYEGPASDISPEVPEYAAVPKCKGRKYKLMDRRSAMKAKAIIKSGSTGYGCVEGCVGTVVHSLSVTENALLNSMDALTVDVGRSVDSTDDYIVGEAMVLLLVL